MWCNTCQQEVPAVNHPLVGQTVCARCQQKLGTSRPAYASSISDDGIALDEPQATTVAESPLPTDDWQTRQQTRRMSRVLRRPGVGTGPQSMPKFSHAQRLDPPHLWDNPEGPAVPHVRATPYFTPHARSAPRRAEGSQLVAWLLVVFGALALAGGVGALGWSLWAGETQYWNLALGVTLAGQGILIFGLVLVVSRLWRNSRFASGKLQDTYARLIELQRTADVLTATRTGGAPAFYAELVRGASPQMLLANLKGQLDQLATRLSSEA